MELLEDKQKLSALWQTQNPSQKVFDYLGLKLAFLSCKVFSPLKGCVCAFFDCGTENTVAFPGVISQRDSDYLAVLLSLARRSKGKLFPNNLLFVFYRPETGKEVCQTGIFRQYRVNRVLTLRQWDKTEPGILAARKNEMLARSCDIRVTAEGAAALDAAVAFYNRATALAQTLPEEVFRLLKFSRLAGNEETARMEGILRVFQDDIYNDIRAGLTAIARELQEQTSCTLTLSMSDGYPPVLNSPEMFDQVQKILPLQKLKAPEMDTDEFSVFLRYAPGLLLFIGAGDETPQKALEFLQTITEKLF
ncbi:MAG: hypothetical protein IKJ94_05780 [Oscillospiraceae bacterium]|nr:hypothetical protein [Oscillospiraceae bacterium]